jgi:MFS family permease
MNAPFKPSEISASRSFVIGAAIMLVTLVGISLSLTVPLLSLEMERMGVSGTMNGINTAVNGIANLIVIPFVPRLAARFGLRRVLLAAIIVGMATIPAFKLVSFPFWFPLRFLFGASLGTLFVLSEYWINAAAPPDRRGLVMGIYGTSLALGFAAGPLLLTFGGTEGWVPYGAAVVLYGLALVPLAFTRGVTPGLETHEDNTGKGVFWFIRAAPVATFAAFVFGAVETGGFSLLPVYGLRLGLPETSAAFLVSIVALGSVLFQIPLGLLSDKVNRRLLLLVCGVCGAVGAMLLPLTSGNLTAFYALLFIFGGISGGLYPVGLAHLGSRYRGLDLASANAAFVMLYSAGLIIGPPAVGAGMDAMGNNGFAFVLASLLGGYGLMVAQRMLRLRHD